MDWKKIESDPSVADAATTTTTTTTRNGGSNKRKLPPAAASLEATSRNAEIGFSENNSNIDFRQNSKKKKYARDKTCPSGWQEYGNTTNTTADARAQTQGERKTKKKKNKNKQHVKMSDEDRNSNEDSTFSNNKIDENIANDKTEAHEDNSKTIVFLEEQVKIQEVTLRGWRQRREEILVEKETALVKKRELIDQRSNLIERQTNLESAREKQLVLQAELKESLAMSREKLNRLLMLEHEAERDERSRDTDTDTDDFLDFSDTLREPSEALIEMEAPKSNLKGHSTFVNISANCDSDSGTEAKEQFPVLFDSYQNVHEMTRYHNEVRNHRSLLGFLPYLDSSQVGEYLTIMLRETYALDEDESSGKEKSLRRQLLQNTCLDVLLLVPSKVCREQCAAYSDATPQFFDPNISLCPYELSGVCADDLCPYQHTRKPTKILARERLPLPSLLPSFLSIEGQTKKVETGEITKTSNVKMDIVAQQEDACAEYEENETEFHLVNRDSTIANNGDTFEGEDFILLPPSSSSNDNKSEHKETAGSDDDDDDDNKREEKPGSNSPDFNEKDERDDIRDEKLGKWDIKTSTSFWWSEKSQICGGAKKRMSKDAKMTELSIFQLLEDTFGILIHEDSKKGTDGSSVSTERRLEIKNIGGGNDIFHGIGVLGRLIDASRLSVHGGRHDVAITSIDCLGGNFRSFRSLQWFSHMLCGQIIRSRFFDQTAPNMSCFEEAFSTQMGFAILSWSVATYRKMEEKHSETIDLWDHKLATGCELCFEVLKNPNCKGVFEASDDVSLHFALSNDSFGKEKESHRNCSEPFNSETKKVYGLRSFISWAQRYSISHLEEPDFSGRSIEEKLNFVWLTAKEFLKDNDLRVTEQENSGNFVDVLDKDLRCMKVILLMGYTIFGYLSNFACGVIAAKESEANEDADHLSASNLAAWTLLDGAIARVLKDMRQIISGFPFLDVILAPLLSCSVASAAYLRNYPVAQKRLIDCLSMNYDHPPSNLMVYSELLWSQLMQLRMSLPNESPVTFNPSDDFVWEPSKALIDENQQLVAKLKSLDIHLRHVVLWGDWMLSSLTETEGNSPTFLQLFSKNQDEAGHNSIEMPSTSIEWRDYLEKLYDKIRKENQDSPDKFTEIYFRNRQYPPPSPLPRLPLFLLHAGKFLIDLNLQGCALQKLPLAFGLYFPNLRNLDLSHNDLRELPESFRKLTQRLKHLKIFCASHNRLESLPSDTLSAASAKHVSLQSPLRILNLSYNQLVSVPSLAGLENLEVLALQHNALVEMSVADWSRLALRLPSLRILTREDQCERETILSWEESTLGRI